MHAVSRLIVGGPAPHRLSNARVHPTFYISPLSPLSGFRPSFSSPPSKREIVAAINGLRRVGQSDRRCRHRRWTQQWVRPRRVRLPVPRWSNALPLALSAILSSS